MEILNKEINRKKYLGKKNQYLSEFKMFVAIEHKLAMKPVMSPSKWAWSKFWTKHMFYSTLCGFCCIYAGKIVRRHKSGDKNLEWDI